MKRLTLTRFSLRHPRVVLLLVALATVLFAVQFPKVHFDNDPENMLAEDEFVRVFHHKVKEKYALYDFVIVGIVNEEHPDGVFNVETLTRIDDLTRELLSLYRNDEGKPAVIRPAREGRAEKALVPELYPAGGWKRFLHGVFGQDPEDLFDENGRSVIIAPEIIAPGVVDNIKQADLGQLKIEYLMERAPTTREEALAIRDDAMGNPLYDGTLVSEDGKAICLYLPLVAKPYSYNVANLVEALTAGWEGQEKVYITGLPVAEDTFGVEMLVQMATSAPLAGLVIFILLYVFFRRFSLIIAPMVLAVVSVLCTMGLLIGLGFDVHIMSSMIAIFLMPIAVADSVHILSEFYDSYHRFNDKAQTVQHVVGHLFVPMLFTSLTTMAGFASLGLTPIPPVRVFGLHVAFGVGLAWLLTMTLVPAYVMLFVSEKSLQTACDPGGAETKRPSRLDPFLNWLGGFTYTRWKLILAFTLLVVAVAVVGISRIKVNDNPVKWFTKTHRIRVADRVLNEHFGGTYTAYLTLAPTRPGPANWAEKTAILREEAKKQFAEIMPTALERFLRGISEHEESYRNAASSDPHEYFARLAEKAAEIDEDTGRAWNDLADAVNYLEPEGLTFAGLEEAVRGVAGVTDEDKARLLAEVTRTGEAQEGPALQEKALEVADRYATLSFRDFVFEMEANLTAPPFKQPEVLRYVEQLQLYLSGLEVVGKTSSAVDALKKAYYELNYAVPQEGDDTVARNDAFFSVPPTPSAVAQVFTQLEGMKKKDSLFHLVTRDYREANLWVQLTRGDNSDMETVVRAVKDYMRAHPAPAGLEPGWAGLTYINVVWQEKMVKGMLSALGSSFVVVLVMMMVLFRSPLYGVLSMIPLSVTIGFIYGLIGLVGKDYDMPVAVLSALTLGLSIDFAIHFLERAREIRKQVGTWEEANRLMFKEPAMAISRNAIVISCGFLPLLVAPLVPYRTVGFFLATIMVVSWLGTLFLLAALVTMLQQYLFKSPKSEPGAH